MKGKFNEGSHGYQPLKPALPEGYSKKDGIPKPVTLTTRCCRCGALKRDDLPFACMPCWQQMPWVEKKAKYITRSQTDGRRRP